MTNHRYQVGGSLAQDDTNYVERSADYLIYEGLVAGDFCYVLSSRQMGKSSLLVRTKYRLEALSISCTAIDLTGIGSDNITADQWYQGIISQLYLGFNLISKINFKRWWQEQENISPIQKLNNFIKDILLVYFDNCRIVILIDEIDSIFALPFSTDDFFTFIRFCYNQRAIAPQYKRLTFAIFGVANPSFLIQDKQRTPFNIGRAIKLTGFTLERALSLTAGFNLTLSESKSVLQDILWWTGGQPFLTQKLCQLVAKDLEAQKSNNISLSRIIKEKIVDRWEIQDEPEHLRTINNRLLYSNLSTVRLLDIYQQILKEGCVGCDNSHEQVELLLSGLVTEDRGYLVVKNPIYQQIFDLAWVEQHLITLRPYATQLKAWLEDGQRKDRLLNHTSLHQALVWAQNKQLADIDYQFLSASQTSVKNQVEQQLNQEQIAKANIEIALDAAREAIAILTEVKQTIKRQNYSFRLPKSWLLGIILFVSLVTISLRSTGSLQNLEFWTYDRLIQNNINSQVSPVITIIEITEKDIQSLSQYPISDRILAQAIKSLVVRNARIIGLDIYRDLPVFPGTKELEQTFNQNYNIYGIEKILNGKVNPPPLLSKLKQVGFNDLIVDPDEKIRRALLSYTLEDGNVQYSFALHLALKHLASINIKPEKLDNNSHQIKLGQAIFYPLQQNDGAYIRAKTKGYQILLNYQKTAAQFDSYSLTELRSNKIPASAIKNRIVLLGVTAESINDFYSTPYNQPKSMAGVFIHANIINQIVRGAVVGDSLIRVLPEAWEWLYISCWIIIGATIAWIFRSWQKLIIAIAIMISIIFILGNLLFAWQWWIPIIPPALGFLLVILVTKLITQQQKSKLPLRQTIKLLLAISQNKPAAGKIALEYIKQGESRENIKIVEQFNQL